MFVKIVCTIGPASDNFETLKSMAEAGMNVARLNFSHGDYEGHEKKLKLIRRVERSTKKPIAALLDTKGPEIRTGHVKDGEVPLKQGAKIILSSCEEPFEGTSEKVWVNYKLLAKEVQPKQNIYIDDGTLNLEVEKIEGDDVHCKVIVGGALRNTKGINLPGSDITLPALSDKDKADIAWGIQHGMEYLALSFVKTRQDIVEVRRLIQSYGGSMKVLAKIETRQAVQNIEEIVNAVDGVMVARGDLGVEVATEDVPLVQKKIIEMCRVRGKVVIVATQMLDSMIRNPRPTRAEASDVANAVLDGTDAVMLSGETASGLYPVQAVATMRKIVDRAEKELGLWGNHLTSRNKNKPAAEVESIPVPDAVSGAAVLIAKQIKAPAIISLSRSGLTAKMISKHRPECPILGVTPSQQTWRELSLWWGVQPVRLSEMSDINVAAREAITTCVNMKLLPEGELVVITAGVPVGRPGSTNVVEVLTTGIILLSGTPLSNKNATGKVCIARTPEEALEKVTPGCILVVRQLSEDYRPVLAKVGAVLFESGLLFSEGNALAMDYNLPCIVGVADAFSTLMDDDVVSIDGTRGLVYRGVVRLVV
ncbi:MAG: pyruvate kinase [Synergistales bacterium]|nr:pyruvate kinase [Synergistales bacterium]MDY6401521.1 pyruvate kinase [Synergistales bacterium]MDY6404628.1 pyruvate kinase [Synergistales bacterium]MDY6410531.1 pyruvate kinase [Synergistales bacterium]MDY6413767.1 pyruvate kinase [Synergistales bacterium]